MFCCILVSCQYTGNDSNAGEYPTFQEDFLCGFLCEFVDSEGNVIKDITSSLDDDNSIMAYVTTSQDNVPNVIVGGDSLVTSLRAENVLFADGGKIQITAKLHYTYKLLNSKVGVRDILYSPQKKSVKLGQIRWLTMEQISSAVNVAQNLEERGKDNQGHDITITHNVSLQFQLIYNDYLNQVRILEFDNKDTIIKSTAIKQNLAIYTPSTNCEYIVVEKSYDIKNKSGAVVDTYIVRELVNKTNSIDYSNPTVTLNYPQENGLVKLTELEFAF